jgi:hypothetical protein
MNETITWRKPAVSGNSPTPMAPSPERQNNMVIREFLNWVFLTIPAKR